MSDQPLPPIVYLPSSGGYTSSRIVPETPDRQRFPFRRYSIDDDGKLVCKTRNISRDTRLKPYDRPPSRPTSLPPRRSPSPQVAEDGSSDPNYAARLFADLVPTIMQTPKALDSVSSICAAHNLDSAVTASIIRAVRKQLEPPEDEASDNSSRPAALPTASASSSKPPDAHTSPPPQDAILPVKQQRPFSSSSGHTIWYTSQSNEDIPSPSDDLNPNIGDLYVHKNRTTDHNDVWLFDFDRTWRPVTNATKAYHPIIPDRVLSIRVNGTPSWITSASYTTIKGRKGKSKGWD
ncbi:hypothetical protein BJ322DRAFT_1104645 [Thelephora terrestris]|uniref:Uncharacterized protein n=1 Tax=Thelephora terrestris TaxID=56493 RepID=A0A9P6HNH3_9AGAM|nr:hypothetical protein BJ322DRAFT_1104645 [Thelephora terrestris]